MTILVDREESSVQIFLDGAAIAAMSTIKPKQKCTRVFSRCSELRKTAVTDQLNLLWILIGREAFQQVLNWSKTALGLLTICCISSQI